MANQIIMPKNVHKHADLKRDLSNLVINGNNGITFKNAEQKLLQSCAIALKMAGYSFGEISKIKAEKGKKRVDAFNNNRLLRKWFGKIESKGEVRNMYSRFKTIKKRLSNGVKIRLRPNSEDTVNGKNMGTFTSPKRFKIYARLIEASNERIASVLIHELMHEWFTDKKLANGTKLSNATTAIQLAKESPGKARRSPENFEQYCKELYP